jgi:hypothetical protein
MAEAPPVGDSEASSGKTQRRNAQNRHTMANPTPSTEPLKKSATSWVNRSTCGRCRPRTYRETYSGVTLTTSAAALTRKNSAASCGRSRPPRVRKDHSRFNTYEAMVATRMPTPFAVVGWSSNTVSFSRYHTALSITKVIAPTVANFSSSWFFPVSTRDTPGSRAATAASTLITAPLGTPSAQRSPGDRQRGEQDQQSQSGVAEYVHGSRANGQQARPLVRQRRPQHGRHQ